MENFVKYFGYQDINLWKFFHTEYNLSLSLTEKDNFDVDGRI